MAVLWLDGRVRRWLTGALAAVAWLGLAAAAPAQETAPVEPPPPFVEPAPLPPPDPAHGAPADHAPAEGEHSEAAAPHAEEEHAGGMPQLRTETFLSQIFWLIVSFGILYWLLSTRALPRIGEILELRQDRIAADLDRAAQLRAEAEEAQARHQQVLAEAQASAQAQLKEVRERLGGEAAERQSSLDRELAERLQAAEARITQAREQALQQIQDVAVEVAQAATRRLIGTEVSEDETRAALDRVMAEAA